MVFIKSNHLDFNKFTLRINQINLDFTNLTIIIIIWLFVLFVILNLN